MKKMELFYVFNKNLEIVTEKKVSVIIDEANDVVHFVRQLEMDIINLMLKPITLEDIYKNLSQTYEGCIKEDICEFINELLEKNIVTSFEDVQKG